MRIRVGVLLAATSCQLGVMALAPAASAQDAVGQPGPHNAITDVPGIRVGHVQSDTAPFLTGTTVVYTPRMSVASVDQRGGAPATKETDLLSPLNSNPGINAIQLGGSSMYGLSATDGIIRWLEDRGEGVPLGAAGVAPIVPAADIYDLNRGGSPKARTSPEWGYLAAEAAAEGPVRQGSVGGGTGARAGGLRSGVGTASVQVREGVWVGAIVVVNPAGSPVNPVDCTLWGLRYGIGAEFVGYTPPTEPGCRPAEAAAGPSAESAAESSAGSSAGQNTTIAVVATNAPLEKAAAARMSGNAHDGMARAITPIHTLADGDTVFAVSTGVSTSEGQALQINDPADAAQLNAIFNAGATTLTRAITKAVLSAQSYGDRRSYCDTYPSACAGMGQLAQWRSVGQAPEVTRPTFNRARRALAAGLVQPPRAGRGAPDGDSGAAEAVEGAGAQGTGGSAAGPASSDRPAGGPSGGAAGWFSSLALAGVAGAAGAAGVAAMRRRPRAF